MNRLRRLAKSNLIALFLQQGSTMAAGLGLQVYLAAVLSKTEFGVVAFIGSVMSMLAFLAHMQCHLLVTREVARNPDDAPMWIARGWQLIAMLMPITSGLALAWVALQDGSRVVIVATALALVALFFTSLMSVSSSVLQGLSRMAALGPTWIVGRIVLIVTTVVLVQAGWSVSGMYVGQIASMLVVTVLLTIAVRRTIGPWPVTVPMRDIKDMVRQSVPFAGVTLFTSVYLMSDVIILEAMRGAEEVAVYRVASLAVVYLPMLAALITRSMYPRAAAHEGDPKAAGEVMNFGAHVLLMLSLPMALGGALVAEPIIALLPGPDYSAAVTPMYWLLPMVPLRFLLNGTGVVMLALHQTNLRARGVALAAVANVGLNLLLIPHYGAAAAAATTLLADVFLIVYQAWTIRRIASGVNYWRPVLRFAPALVAMAVAVLLTPSLHVIVRIGLGATVYGAVIIATGAFTRQQIAQLIRL